MGQNFIFWGILLTIRKLLRELTNPDPDLSISGRGSVAALVLTTEHAI